MKLLLIFVATLCGAVLASPEVQLTPDNVEEMLGEILKDLQVDLPLELFEKLRIYSSSGRRSEIGRITAIVDEYVDKIFDNLRTLLANSSSNSIAIPNISLKLDQNSQLNLTNGLLEGIASLTRDGDVVLDYSTGDNNVITLNLPIRFDDIKYSFNYSTNMLLITYRGGLHGEIKNVKIDAVLSFNFTTYHASLDHYDMKDTGEITIKFTGNDLLDWLADAISTVITTTLHPLIIDILQKAISGVITNVVTTINEAIDGFLYPTTAEVTTAVSFI